MNIRRGGFVGPTVGRLKGTVARSKQEISLAFDRVFDVCFVSPLSTPFLFTLFFFFFTFLPCYCNRGWRANVVTSCFVVVRGLYHCWRNLLMIDFFFVRIEICLITLTRDN